MSYSHSGNWIDPFLKQREGALFQFAGAHSATANRIALLAAKQFVKEGRDANDIQIKTGWFQGEDSCWRYEISDHDARLDLSHFTVENGQDIFRGQLGSILKHPRLYAAYPFLQNYDTHLVIRDGDRYEGFQEPARIEGNELHGARLYASANSPDLLLDVITHEIQHAIQDVEGFAYGSNTNFLMTSYIASLKERKEKLEANHEHLLRLGAARGPRGRELDIISAELTHIDFALNEASSGNWNEAFYTLYYNTSGEREARKSAADRKLSPSERARRNPIPSVTSGLKPTILFNGMPYQTIAAELNITPTANITLLPRESILKISHFADRDTFNHECAHLFLRFEAASAQGRKVSEYQKTILDYLGVESFSEIDRVHEEKFAYGFEAYMREREFLLAEEAHGPIQKIFNNVARWVGKFLNRLEQQSEPIDESVKSMFSSLIEPKNQPDYENQKMADNHERKIAMQLFQTGIYERGEAYRCAQLLSSYALAKVERDPDYPTVDRVFDQMNLRVEAVTSEELISDIAFDFETFNIDDVTQAFTNHHNSSNVSIEHFNHDDHFENINESSSLTRTR